MKKILRLFYVSMLIVLLTTSCAKTMQVHEVPYTALQNEAARVYIFRPSYTAYSTKERVYNNNMIVGQVGPRGYIAWETKAGDIVLDGPWGFIKIIAQPGKTYYFELKTNLTGFGANALKLITISEERGKELLSKLKPPKVKIVS